MIEKIILDYLNGSSAIQEAGLSAFMEVPVVPPAEYITIEKTGSSEENHIRSAMVAIQSYADSLYQAAEINELVIHVMDDMIILPQISRVSLNSDYNFTDTRTKKYRYQAVFNIIYMEG